MSQKKFLFLSLAQAIHGVALQSILVLVSPFLLTLKFLMWAPFPWSSVLAEV